MKLRRAIVVLMSAQGQTVKDITSLMQVGEDYVRDVIHVFNERGFDALDRGAGSSPCRGGAERGPGRAAPIVRGQDSGADVRALASGGAGVRRWGTTRRAVTGRSRGDGLSESRTLPPPRASGPVPSSWPPPGVLRLWAHQPRKGARPA
ncbi:helix-turn-helix domain-containing protein [Streptomyces sp. NPDC086838]|uniref:helix-turn-helix domain-containing protein n=1 Tax=Streptomyces sp. NPDC086838 TaxID=3365762 RepID=UPI003830ED8C